MNKPITKEEALNILAAAGLYSLFTGKYQIDIDSDTRRLAVQWGMAHLPDGDSVKLICQAVDTYFGFNPDFI